MGRRGLRQLVLLAVLALLAGCSSDERAGPAPTTTTPAPTTTTAAPTTPTSAGSGPGGEQPALDWASLTAEPVPVGGGWALADAEGDGPFYDVTSDGAFVGSLEVASFPVETLEGVARVLDRGGSEAEALEEHARQFVETFRVDRRTGCGDDYGFAGTPALALDTPAGDVVRTGFTGTRADGAPSERVVQFAGLREGDLVVLTATAADQGGCLAPEGDTFTTEQLDGFTPVLTDVVRRSGLPPSSS